MLLRLQNLKQRSSEDGRNQMGRLLISHIVFLPGLSLPLWWLRHFGALACCCHPVSKLSVGDFRVGVLLPDLCCCCCRRLLSQSQAGDKRGDKRGDKKNNKGDKKRKTAGRQEGKQIDNIGTQKGRLEETQNGRQEGRQRKTRRDT